MTNKEKKRYLMQYRKLELQIDRELEELERWKSKATKVTPTYTDTPKGNSSGDRLQTTVEKIIELSAQINRDIDHLVDTRCAIWEAIQNIQDESYKTLLSYRYIDGMTWEQIATKMYYDRSHVCRLHGQALNAIILDEKNETK